MSCLRCVELTCKIEQLNSNANNNTDNELKPGGWVRLYSYAKEEGAKSFMIHPPIL